MSEVQERELESGIFLRRGSHYSALNKYITPTPYHLVEWSEGKVLKFVIDGWSLSWDKANKRYKLQKRIKGKVKSYTLLRELNSYCGELREALSYLKLIEKYGLEKAQEKLLLERGVVSYPWVFL